jgi:hypothetical protein
MFVQSKVVFIVGENVGNASKINSTLERINVKQLFFSSNPNIFDAYYKNFLDALPSDTIFSIDNGDENGAKNYFISIPFFIFSYRSTY